MAMKVTAEVSVVAVLLADDSRQTTKKCLYNNTTVCNCTSGVSLVAPLPPPVVVFMHILIF